jgi:hypothetical protein
MSGFKVFISHEDNPRDNSIVDSTEKMLKCANIIPYIALRDHHQLGRSVWEEKIRPNLDSSDVFVAIWTEISKESEWVRKEIKYAYANMAVRFLVIQKGEEIPKPYDKIDCIFFDPSNPNDALYDVVNSLKGMKRKKESNEFWGNVGIILLAIGTGIAVGLAAYFASKKK